MAKTAGEAEITITGKNKTGSAASKAANDLDKAAKAASKAAKAAKSSVKPAEDAAKAQQKFGDGAAAVNSKVGPAATAVGALGFAFGGAAGNIGAAGGAIANFAMAAQSGGPVLLAITAVTAGIGLLVQKYMDLVAQLEEARQKQLDFAKTAADTAQNELKTLQTEIKNWGMSLEEVRMRDSEKELKDINTQLRVNSSEMSSLQKELNEVTSGWQSWADAMRAAELEKDIDNLVKMNDELLRQQEGLKGTRKMLEAKGKLQDKDAKQKERIVKATKDWADLEREWAKVAAANDKIMADRAAFSEKIAAAVKKKSVESWAYTNKKVSELLSKIQSLSGKVDLDPFEIMGKTFEDSADAVKMLSDYYDKAVDSAKKLTEEEEKRQALQRQKDIERLTGGPRYAASSSMMSQNNGLNIGGGRTDSNFDAFKSMGMDFMAGFGGSIVAGGKQIASAFIDPIKQLFMSLPNQIMGLVMKGIKEGGISGLKQAILELFYGEEGIVKQLNNISDFLMLALQLAFANLPTALSEAVESLITVVMGLLKGAPTLVSQLLDFIVEFIVSVIEMLPEALPEVANIIGTLVGWIFAIYLALQRIVLKLIVQIIAMLANGEFWQDLVFAFIHGFSETVKAAAAGLSDRWKAFKKRFQKVADGGFLSILKFIRRGIGKFFKGWVMLFVNMFGAFWNLVLDGLLEIIPNKKVFKKLRSRLRSWKADVDVDSGVGFGDDNTAYFGTSDEEDDGFGDGGGGGGVGGARMVSRQGIPSFDIGGMIREWGAGLRGPTGGRIVEAHPGEAVLTRDTVQRLGGEQTINAMNAGAIGSPVNMYFLTEEAAQKFAREILIPMIGRDAELNFMATNGFVMR